MKTSTVLAAGSLALASALAGCGSSKSSSSAAAPAPAATTSSSAASGSPTTGKPVALITTKHAKLGAVLAYGSKKLTVYLFEADKGSGSSCMGACAKFWPPVTGAARAAGGAMASKLGMIKRPDGTTQVTYQGHPLYLFEKDRDDGDTYGQGSHAFGAGWYVLNPAGNKIDES